MADNGPRMMENFDRWGKDRKDTKKIPSNDRLREDMRDHHDRNAMDQNRKDMPITGRTARKMQRDPIKSNPSSIMAGIPAPSIDLYISPE